MDNTLEKFKNNLQAYADICNGGRGKYDPLTVFHNQAEYNEACNILHTHARLCGSNTFGKGNSIRGNQSMRMTRNTFRLEIQYHRPQPRQQNVRESSKDAYHSIDLVTKQGQVAACILDASRSGDITRAEVAYRLGVKDHHISGRVAELLAMSETGTIKIGENHYRLVELKDRRPSTCPGASNVKAYPLRLVMCAPNDFQAAAPAAQTQTQLF